MMEVRRLFIALILFTLVSGCNEKLYRGLFLESREVSVGDFNGFTIGMNSQEALQKIKSMQVSVINPIPHDDFVITANNLDQIDKIKRTEGIRVMDHDSYAVNIAIVDDHVIESWHSTKGLGVNWFKSGDSLTTFLEELKEVLKTYKDLTVIPVIPRKEGGALHLKDLPEGAEQSLLTNSAWRFEDVSVKPGGAMYKLYFSSGKLEKIKYERRKIKFEM